MGAKGEKTPLTEERHSVADTEVSLCEPELEMRACLHCIGYTEKIGVRGEKTPHREESHSVADTEVSLCEQELEMRGCVRTLFNRVGNECIF